MVRDNETVADIVKEMRWIPNDIVYAKYADRIEAAHQREVEKLCGELVMRTMCLSDGLFDMITKAYACKYKAKMIALNILLNEGMPGHYSRNELYCCHRRLIEGCKDTLRYDCRHCEFNCPSRGMAQGPKTEAREGRKRCAPLTGSPERESGSKPNSGAASGLAAKTDEAENKRPAKAALANTANGQASRPPRNEGSADGRMLVSAAGLGSRVGRAARASASISDK